MRGGERKREGGGIWQTEAGIKGRRGKVTERKFCSSVNSNVCSMSYLPFAGVWDVEVRGGQEGFFSRVMRSRNCIGKRSEERMIWVN